VVGSRWLKSAAASLLMPNNDVEKVGGLKGEKRPFLVAGFSIMLSRLQVAQYFF